MQTVERFDAVKSYVGSNDLVRLKVADLMEHWCPNGADTLALSGLMAFYRKLSPHSLSHTLTDFVLFVGGTPFVLPHLEILR